MAWLLFTLTNLGNEPSNQIKTKTDYLTPAITSSENKPSMEQGADQANNSADQEKNANSIDTTDSIECDERCSSLLSILDDNLELDDENFHKLEAYIEELAAYLQYDESKRRHYLQLALTTADGDKRSYLTEVFKHLPYEQKIEIGADFINSENWRVRAYGVTLITEDGIADQSMANIFIDVLSNETNPYVKGSILKSLEHSSNLQGNPEILQQLGDVINHEPDFAIRKAALNAKKKLSDKPYHILPDAINALRTSDPGFQLAGLIAIDDVLNKEQKYIAEGAYIDKVTIKNYIENILNTNLYGDPNEHDVESLAKEANAIYLRHF